MSSSPPSATLPPHPHFVLRGHSDQIHSVCFVPRQRSASADLLLSGDALGFVVLWKLQTRRPLAVWQAHDGAVLRVSGANGRIISHGRDHKLYVWQLPSTDETQKDSGLSRELPLDAPLAKHRRKPWLLHAIDVNALNFCAFAHCSIPHFARSKTGNRDPAAGLDAAGGERGEVADEEDLVLAVPAAASLESDAIDIFHLPSQTRISSIAASSKVKTGMVMALRILSYNGIKLRVIGGFESGHVLIFEGSLSLTEMLDGGSGGRAKSQQDSQSQWQLISTLQPHTQPVLSLDVTPDLSSVLSSSADANIAQISLLAATDGHLAQVLKTGHSGQQSLAIRDDGLIFATAGWDGRCRVYETASLVELAVLKWHSQGCYAVAFSSVASSDGGSSSAPAAAAGATFGIQGGGGVDRGIRAGEAGQDQSKAGAAGAESSSLSSSLSSSYGPGSSSGIGPPPISASATVAFPADAEAETGEATEAALEKQRDLGNEMQMQTQMQKQMHLPLRQQQSKTDNNSPSKQESNNPNQHRRRLRMQPNLVAVGSKDGKVSLWEIY